VLPDIGWVSVPMQSPAHVETAVSVLRKSYDLAVEQRDRRFRR
jgi:hypothetical protein